MSGRRRDHGARHYCVLDTRFGENMLDPNDMRLRDLVGWLTTPARSGVYLSTSDLERVGRDLGIRVMPMSRAAAVEQLFRTAALDDAVDELFAALRAEINSHRERYLDCDSLALQPWIDRAGEAAHTIDLLQEAWRNREIQPEE